MTANATAAERSLNGGPLTREALAKIDAYWRACSYLAVGMIYLQANPLLREPLRPEQIKNRLLGHWGASPGLSFMYVHLNRLIIEHNQEAIFLAGPGHGAPGVLAPVYLEGTYSEIYPDKSEDEEGMRRFFKQFSFAGGIGSHCTPETPGSIHEGGELGYSISHAFRGRIRQSAPLGRGGGGRRRGRDRTTGHVLALGEVPQPHPGRRGTADPSPERL